MKTNRIKFKCFSEYNPYYMVIYLYDIDLPKIGHSVIIRYKDQGIENKYEGEVASITHDYDLIHRKNEIAEVRLYGTFAVKLVESGILDTKKVEEESEKDL